MDSTYKMVAIVWIASLLLSSPTLHVMVNFAYLLTAYGTDVLRRALTLDFHIGFLNVNLYVYYMLLASFAFKLYGLQGGRLDGQLTSWEACLNFT